MNEMCRYLPRFNNNFLINSHLFPITFFFTFQSDCDNDKRDTYIIINNNKYYIVILL